MNFGLPEFTEPWHRRARNKPVDLLLPMKRPFPYVELGLEDFGGQNSSRELSEDVCE